MSAVRVLVVDDDEQVRELASCVLRAAGYEAVVTGSAEEAFELLPDGFDVALVDLYLGGECRGLELAHLIRRTSDTDVIVITARPAVGTAVGALREGVYDYLIKPFPPGGLERAVDRCAEKRRLSQDLARERALRQRLAEEIAHRERLERQVRQDQKMEALGRLAGTIAHDFNNYLVVILGAVDGLLREGMDPGTGGAARDIRRAAQDAASLARQILAFSRRECAEPAEVELGGLLREMSGLLRRIVGPDVEVLEEFATALSPVRIDVVQLRQVVVNLTVNARDAMAGNGGRLVLRATETCLEFGHPSLYPDGLPGRYVLLEVADTGAGMDAATMERVFEPFFTTKDAGKGTGLGLPCVYGIVRQAGGRIEMDSAPGRGTAVRLYFPLSKFARRPERSGDRAAAPSR